MRYLASLLLFNALFSYANAADKPSRKVVKLPGMMQEQLLANMRDHLLAMQEIQLALGAAQFDTAATLAEQRLGMSSRIAHDASRMAAYMPKDMQVAATQMHQAASEFAKIAQDSALQGDVKPAVRALANITAQCVACHRSYCVE
ncbi:MAG: hypothetical protein HY080_04250 [Gammaproteobacteria bacterium]|nr:hypothetical protein [Gammaproteobacteria bacterium]